jgi:hypothetical protein
LYPRVPSGTPIGDTHRCRHSARPDRVPLPLSHACTYTHTLLSRWVARGGAPYRVCLVHCDCVERPHGLGRRICPCRRVALCLSARLPPWLRLWLRWSGKHKGSHGRREGRSAVPTLRRARPRRGRRSRPLSRPPSRPRSRHRRHRDRCGRDAGFNEMWTRCRTSPGSVQGARAWRL